MSSTPDNINVNYERFPPEYFSGSNVHIFFDDVYIDEITTLQFTMQEQVMPLYGYNSFTYDEMLRGSRIIQGMFRINFKHVDYIRSAVNKILSDDTSNYTNFPEWSTEKVQQKKNKLYDISRRGWSREFDKITEEFKEMMWAEGGEDYREIESDGNKAYFDFDAPFNILIKYGPYDMPNSTYNIENKYRKNISQGTIIKIMDIQIDQVTQNVDASGKPVSEDYSFMAQDISRGHNKLTQGNVGNINEVSGDLNEPNNTTRGFRN